MFEAHLQAHITMLAFAALAIACLSLAEAGPVAYGGYHGAYGYGAALGYGAGYGAFGHGLYGHGAAYGAYGKGLLGAHGYGYGKGLVGAAYPYGKVGAYGVGAYGLGAPVLKAHAAGYVAPHAAGYVAPVLKGHVGYGGVAPLAGAAYFG